MTSRESERRGHFGALQFPSGHTDGDSIIFFPKNNVVHMGDDFVRYAFLSLKWPAAAGEGLSAAMETKSYRTVATD